MSDVEPRGVGSELSKLQSQSFGFPQDIPFSFDMGSHWPKDRGSAQNGSWLRKVRAKRMTDERSA